MKVIIAGSREDATYEDIEVAVTASGFSITEVVTGMAPGSDSHGRTWAINHGVPFKEMPAEWARWGRKRAGGIRNVDMAAYVRDTDPEGGGLILVWNGVSTGSAHMLKVAKNLKLKGIYVHMIAAKETVR